MYVNTLVTKFPKEFQSEFNSLRPSDAYMRSRRQTIIWTNAGILLIGALGTNVKLKFVHFHWRKCFWKCRLEKAAILSRPQCVNAHIQAPVKSDTSGLDNGFFMMTSSNGNIFRVTGPLCGEFTGPGEFPTQRPVTRSFDVFFHLRLNKRLSKQPWGWWIETPS